MVRVLTIITAVPIEVALVPYRPIIEKKKQITKRKKASKKGEPEVKPIIRVAITIPAMHASIPFFR